MKQIKRVTVVLLIGILFLAMFAGCSELSQKDSAKLSFYTVDIVVDDAEKTLSGKLSLDYRNNYDVELKDIAFHLYPAAYREGARFKPVESGTDILEAYPNGINYGGITVETVSLNGKAADYRVNGQDEDILTVNLADLLMPEQRIQIDIAFSVKIPNMRHRFGWYEKTINLGNFYPIVCVYENGAWVTDPYYAWGDPFYSEASNYTVSVTAPQKYKAAMSGAVTAENTEGGQVKSSATIKSARDFAIVLGEFTEIKTTANGVLVRYYYYNDPTPELALTAAADSLKTFSALFGAYPYESFSTVQTAFLNGGMEYPGLTYISDRVTGELYREVIVHEAAHQWWYGVVGNNQVADAWLDETLAEYSTTLFYEKNPSYNVSYQARIADALNGYSLYCDMYKKETYFSTVMRRRIPDFHSALEYTYMTYVKGQIMLDSLRANIGDEIFIAALKNYYQDNKFKIASPELLIAALENASKRELAPFFTAWIEGKAQVYAGE